MIKYELLTTLTPLPNNILAPSREMPELVHLDEPAISVMTDFSQTIPTTLPPDTPIDDALKNMKLKEVHLLLVTDEHHKVLGVIGSEDILGEKPIKIIQERRIPRPKVLVKMIMVPLSEITAFDITDIEHARVGNVVNTLKTLNKPYSLVIKQDEGANTLRGIFTVTQISKQLHFDIKSSVTKAATLAELQKRHTK